MKPDIDELADQAHDDAVVRELDDAAEANHQLELLRQQQEEKYHGSADQKG